MIYAMSDIHGHADAFEKSLALVNFEDPSTKLVLLGDYVDGPDVRRVLDRIMELQQEHPDQVIALKGNHEDMMLDELREKTPVSLRRYARWMRDLPLWHTEPGFIFVHAGIDEDAVRDGIDWRIGTSDEMFLWKFPAQTEALPMDEKIVAGHVSTMETSGIDGFEDVWWDGASHIYIDGNVFASGRVNVLAIDPDTGRFWQL